MKTLSIIVSIILLFICNSQLLASVNKKDKKDFKRLKRQIVRLSKDDSNSKCPGVKHAKYCGDKKCNKKENAQNCPFDCADPVLMSYNQQTICEGIKKVYIPASIEEAVAAVKQSYEKGFRIKVSGKAHTVNSMICTKGALIVTEKLDRVHKIEQFEGHETVLVDAGVTLKKLGAWLHRKKRSIGVTHIGFNGITVGGAISTGTHGSSTEETSVMIDIVQSIKFIKPNGKLVEYTANKHPNIMKALRTSLGMLGMIAQVRLKIQPQFKIRMKTTYMKDDVLFKGNGPIDLVRGCIYGTVSWFPNLKKVMLNCGKKTHKKAERGARNAFIDVQFPKFLVKPIKGLLQKGACDNRYACLMADFNYLNFRLNPPYQKKRRLGFFSKASSDVTGYSHKMISADLTDLGYVIRQTDYELALPQSRIMPAMKYIRDYFNKTNKCSALVGIYFRFTPSDNKSLLAHSSSFGDYKKGEPIIFFELNSYKPWLFSKSEHEEYERPNVLLMENLMKRYSGRIHWAKNIESLFDTQRELGTFKEPMKQFQKIVNRFDPFGVFANDYGRVIGLSWPNEFSSDRQCSGVDKPLCVQGRVAAFKNECFARKSGYTSKDSITCKF